MNRVYEESKFCTLQHGATKETWRFVQVGLVNFCGDHQCGAHLEEGPSRGDLERNLQSI
jgi:hypothetical protein